MNGDYNKIYAIACILTIDIFRKQKTNPQVGYFTILC